MKSRSTDGRCCASAGLAQTARRRQGFLRKTSLYTPTRWSIYTHVWIAVPKPCPPQQDRKRLPLTARAALPEDFPLESLMLSLASARPLNPAEATIPLSHSAQWATEPLTHHPTHQPTHMRKMSMVRSLPTAHLQCGECAFVGVELTRGVVWVHILLGS